MKKFLAILTIVAMLSGMVVIGASAASTYAFEEDFEGDFGFGDETVYKHPNDYSSSISLVDAPKGIYKPADVADINCVQVTGNGSTNAIETARFAIKVPGFFEGKTAGTYTVEFDYKLVGGNTSELYAMRLDVGSTEGGGAKYIKNKEGFNANNYHEIPTNTTATDWQKVKTVLTYDGSVVENPDCDDTSLVLLIGALNSHLNPADYSGRFQIDNIKISNIIGEPEAALESTVAPYAVAPSFEEDFNDNYAYVGENTQYAHPNANDKTADYALVGKNIAEGLYAQGYSTDKAESARFTLVERAEGDYAIEAPRVFLKIPNFFEGQAAGNYVVEFDVKLVGHTTGFYLQRLDVGSTVGKNAVWFKGAEGFSGYGWLNPGISTANTGWQSVKLSLPYSGSVTATTDTNCDVNALVLGFTPTTYNASTKYQFDNFKVYPVDNTTGTVVDYAGKDMVVNNTVYVNNGAPLNAEVISAAYDQNGNLRAVGTAPVSIAAGESSKAANVTIEEMPAGVTANWTFKTFLWSDLDNEIEPLYDAVNPFDANVKQSIGVEFNPVTSVPDDYTSGTFTMAKDWVSDGAYCLTDYALNGRYSMFIPNGKSAYLVDDGFLAANGEGTYTVRVWLNGANTLMTRLHMNGKLRRHNGNTDPYMLNNATHVLDADGTTKIKKTVNGKDYYLHQVTLETALLTGDSSKEPQGFKFGAYDGDKWVEVESIVFTPAQ